MKMSGCLRFICGPVASGKTLALIAFAHSLEQSGISFAIVVPTIDTRAGQNVVWSRTGMSRPALSVVANDDLLSLCKEVSVEHLIVDETQFLAVSQVGQLGLIVDRLGRNVTCYGLLADFRNTLFPASAALMTMADTVEQLHTPCRLCGRKAALEPASGGRRPHL